MNTLLSIPLSILILFQSLNIHIEDFFKLNELVEHAQLHKERYGDNFFTFLSKHYGSLKEAHEKQHQEEEKEHNHPPIDHSCNSQVNLVFLLQTHSFSLEESSLNVKKVTNFYYQDKFSTFEKQQVFQPPQVS